MSPEKFGIRPLGRAKVAGRSEAIELFECIDCYPAERQTGLASSLPNYADGLAAYSAGRWDEAERLWTQVRQRDPNHPDALYSLGVHAFQRGDLAGAIALLAQAADAAPNNPTVRLTLSVAYGEKGDADAEWAAITAALEAGGARIEELGVVENPDGTLGVTGALARPFRRVRTLGVA